MFLGLWESVDGHWDYGSLLLSEAGGNSSLAAFFFPDYAQSSGGGASFLGARVSSPRAVHAGETSSPWHTAAATCRTLKGGEIVQSIDFPRVCTRAESPRSQEVGGSRKSTDRT